MIVGSTIAILLQYYCNSNCGTIEYRVQCPPPPPPPPPLFLGVGKVFQIVDNLSLDTFYTAKLKLLVVKQTLGDNRLYNRLIDIETLTIVVMHRYSIV